MAQLRPLDPAFPIDRQLTVQASPVMLVNVLSADAADVDALLKAWKHNALWDEEADGLISTQLHHAIGESCVFMNYAVWESVERFRQAFMHPEFRDHIGNYPSSTVVSPHLFTRMTVSNLCVA